MFLTYVPYLYTQWKLKQRPGFNCACNRNCTISRLHTGAAQSRGCLNLISRLVQSFWILRMCSTILRLHKFLDCVEHMYWTRCNQRGGGGLCDSGVTYRGCGTMCVESHGFLPPLPHQWIAFTCESTTYKCSTYRQSSYESIITIAMVHWRYVNHLQMSEQMVQYTRGNWL